MDYRVWTFQRVEQEKETASETNVNIQYVKKVTSQCYNFWYKMFTDDTCDIALPTILLMLVVIYRQQPSYKTRNSSTQHIAVVYQNKVTMNIENMLQYFKIPL